MVGERCCEVANAIQSIAQVLYRLGRTFINVSSWVTVGGWGREFQYPVVSVEKAQYLR